MMEMKLQKYSCNQEGYDPFLISKGWQVAYLTACDQHHLYDMVDTEVHADTDEVFILVKGKAVLLTAEHHQNATSDFSAENLELNATYNVPAGLWHNIAMDDDAVIIIVEKSETHLHDVRHKSLSDQERETVNALVRQALA